MYKTATTLSPRYTFTPQMSDDVCRCVVTRRRRLTELWHDPWSLRSRYGLTPFEIILVLTCF